MIDLAKEKEGCVNLSAKRPYMEIRKAVLYMLLSTLVFTVMNTLVKSMIHIGTYELVFFRALGSVVLGTSILIYQKVPLLGKQRPLLVLRAILGLISILFYYQSMQHLQVGTAITLRYVSPIFATLFAILLLKEDVRPIQWLFFGLAFAGVVLIKGLDNQVNTHGFLLAMGAAVFSGAVYVVIRRLGPTENPMVIVNYFMGISLVISGLFAWPRWVAPQGIEWPLLLSLGIWGFVAQVFMTKAFQIAVTNVVAPLKYMEVIFTVLMGMAFLGELYTYWSVLGMLMIMGGLLLNLRFKTRK